MGCGKSKPAAAVEEYAAAGQAPGIYGGDGGDANENRQFANSLTYQLFHAAKFGNDFEVKRTLASKDVSPDSRHFLGWTPLHVAAVNGRYAVVESLLQEGADPDVKEEFSTAYRVATTNNINSKFVALARSDEFHPSVDPNASFEGFTAMHYATLFDSSNTVKVLLEKGANPSIRNALGHTPMDYVREDNKTLKTLLKMDTGTPADFKKNL